MENIIKRRLIKELVDEAEIIMDASSYVSHDKYLMNALKK